MAVRFVLSVFLVLLQGARSEVCETGSEELSVLQVTRASSSPGVEPDAGEQALIESGASVDKDAEASGDFHALFKSLLIANELAEKLHLPKTSGLTLPRRCDKHSSGPGHKVNRKMFTQEANIIHQMMTTHHAGVSKSLEMTTQLSTLLYICDGGNMDYWRQRVCAISCSAATAVVSAQCVKGNHCSASVQEASKLCADCPDQMCLSPWSRSMPNSHMCKSTHSASMLALSSDVADQSEWAAEKATFEKIYRSPTCDPLSRSVLLQEQMTQMLKTCAAGVQYPGATSLIQGTLFPSIEKFTCAIGCSGAIVAAIPGCVGGVATGGLTCVLAITAIIGTCGACPDAFCHTPPLFATVYPACLAHRHGPWAGACEFCADWYPGVNK